MTTLIIALGIFLLGFGAGWARRIAAETSGERAVPKRLRAEFPGCHLLNNVTLPCADGTTQVDHIAVSQHGVFVIESKHYTGWIFASAKSAKWTQVIYKVKNQFQNPIRQNFKHCVEVRRLLDFLPPEHVHSAVVFTGDAEFKTGMPAGVFSLDGLVREMQGRKQEVMSLNRVHFCVGRLECLRLALTDATDVQHQASLANRFRR